jgi:hypothetical protein
MLKGFENKEARRVFGGVSPRRGGVDSKFDFLWKCRRNQCPINKKRYLSK